MIATTAYQLGLIDLSLFSLAVAVGIITTAMSPIASRMAMRRMRGPRVVQRLVEVENTALSHRWRKDH